MDNSQPTKSSEPDDNKVVIIGSLALLALMVLSFGFDSLAKIGVIIVGIVGALFIGLSAKPLSKLGDGLGMIISVIMAIFMIWLVFCLVGQTQ